jgi:hypothetical protein
MFLSTTYQNGKNLPIDHKVYQVVVKYSKWPQNISILFIPRPHKIYPIGIFGF